MELEYILRLVDSWTSKIAEHVTNVYHMYRLIVTNQEPHTHTHTHLKTIRISINYKMINIHFRIVFANE